MNNITNGTWRDTANTAEPSAISQQFSQALTAIKQGGADKTNSDGSKTIIERNVTTLPDGSQMVILTQVTISATGKRSESKIIGRFKLNNSNFAAELKQQLTANKLSDDQTTQPNSNSVNSFDAATDGLIKNTAGKDSTSQNSTTNDSNDLAALLLKSL